MTPKEAIEIFAQADKVVSFVQVFGFEGGAPTIAQYRQAIATITHHITPHTEPPTVEEVRDEGVCLLAVDGVYRACRGKFIRDTWRNGDKWLPIPEVTP